MISVSFNGLQDLAGRFDEAPKLVERVVSQALFNSIAMIETKAAELTPKDTGYLRSSIGSGTEGFSYVRGFEAGVGTNVNYAVYVENDDNARHPIGQAHFMRDGLANATPYIIQEFEKAMVDLSEELTKNL